MADPLRAGRIKKVLKTLEPPMPASGNEADPLILETPEEAKKKRKWKRKKDETGIDEPVDIIGQY